MRGTVREATQDVTRRNQTTTPECQQQDPAGQGPALPTCTGAALTVKFSVLTLKGKTGWL